MGLGPGSGLPGLPEEPAVPGDNLAYEIWISEEFTVYVARLILGFFWAILVNLATVLVMIFQKIRKFLTHIWQKYITAAVTWLGKEYIKFRDWLRRTLKPILKRLQDIKKWYDVHILKQQLRLLRMIQTIRRILGILRIFHVGWAAKLDNALADVQNRVEKTISVVRGLFNEIINTLAMVLDPTLLIKTNVLGATLLSNLGAVKRIFAFGWDRPLSAAETETQTQNAGRYHTSTANDHITTLTLTGLTAYNLTERDASRKGITDATNAALPF